LAIVEPGPGPGRLARPRVCETKLISHLLSKDVTFRFASIATYAAGRESAGACHRGREHSRRHRDSGLGSCSIVAAESPARRCGMRAITKRTQLSPCFQSAGTQRGSEEVTKLDNAIDCSTRCRGAVDRGCICAARKRGTCIFLKKLGI